jgi:hypothetical protein
VSRQNTILHETNQFDQFFICINSGGSGFSFPSAYFYEKRVYYKKTSIGEDVIARKSIGQSSTGVRSSVTLSRSTYFEYYASSGKELMVTGMQWEVPDTFQMSVRLANQVLFNTKIYLNVANQYAAFILVDSSILAIKVDGTIVPII